jgi:hypothetical protein
MKKLTMLAAVTALAAMMLAATPVLADDLDFDGFDDGDFGFFVDCDDFDIDGICDNDEGFGFFNDGFAGDGIVQTPEQEADSGEIDQTFEVS